LTPSLFMLGGLVLLAAGAEGLVRGSSALALRLAGYAAYPYSVFP
jgi:hypothetical protein